MTADRALFARIIAAGPDTAWPLAELAPLGQLYDALVAAGALVTKPSTGVSCDEDEGCLREVVDDPRRVDRVRLVCTERPARCAPRSMARASCRDARLSPSGLAAYLAAVGGGTPPLAANSGLAPFAVVPRGADACVLAVYVGPPEQLVDTLAARETDTRRWLVWTAHHAALPPAVAARFGKGAHVEVADLDGALDLTNGTARLRLPGALVAVPPPAPARDATLQPRSFSELRIYLCDGETISVRVGARAQRRTHVDLGMSSQRSRRPTEQWRLLVALCEAGGAVKWKQLGSFDVAKRRHSRLRVDLQRVFGLEEDPFHAFRADKGWTPKFWVGQTADED